MYSQLQELSWKSAAMALMQWWIFSWLLPQEATTVKHLLLSDPIKSILFCRTNPARAPSLSPWIFFMVFLCLAAPFSTSFVQWSEKSKFEIFRRNCHENAKRRAGERCKTWPRLCHVLSCSLANGVVEVVKTNTSMKAQQILIHHISPFGKHLIGSGFILAWW